MGSSQDAEMRQARGVGPYKLERFGPRFLERIARHQREKPVTSE